jgi:peptidoglycan/xylan/chitin deacetylase (PgdA/CDA1 family)
MLRVKLAPGFRAEQAYTVGVLLGEYLGIPFAIEEGCSASSVTFLSAEGKVLLLPQTLFSGEDRPLSSLNLPAPTCRQLNVEREGLPASAFCAPEVPVLYGEAGEGGAWWARGAETATLHADVIGSSFFMLARLEEIAATDIDAHGCFPAEASIAYRESFLTRPIVNEYLELLWLAIRDLWPRIQRRPRSFRIEISHDVDRPWAYRDLGLRDRLWAIRDALRRGTLPSVGGSPLLNGVLAAAGLPHRDPFDTFDWLMDREDAAGLRPVFYFLTSQETQYDARYSIEAHDIRALIRRIQSRGHEIGLHGSYSSWLSAERVRGQLSRLADVTRQEGATRAPVGGRQHYLRWRAPDTWRAYEEAGLQYDASVGFNKHAGFRCGTCYEYPVFDAVKRVPLGLRERPLMVMDITLLAEDTMALAIEPARQLLRQIADRVRLFGGALELLWHNNHAAEDSNYFLLYADSLRL